METAFKGLYHPSSKSQSVGAKIKLSMGKDKDLKKKATARITETIKTVILIPSPYIDTMPKKKSRLLYQTGPNN